MSVDQEPNIGDVYGIQSVWGGGVTESGFDFIISSEAFEHVEPTAFDNLARLLKPGGTVIFSVPWSHESDTVEFFPNLYDWQIVKLRHGPVLLNALGQHNSKRSGISNSTTVPA